MSVVFAVADSKVFLRHNPIKIFFLTKLKKERKEKENRESN